MFSVIELAEYIESKEKYGLSEEFEDIIKRKIGFLANNPKHNSLEVHEYHTSCKINGKKRKVWSFYVNMKYRVDFFYSKRHKIYLLNFSDHHDTSPKATYEITSIRNN